MGLKKQESKKTEKSIEEDIVLFSWGCGLKAKKETRCDTNNPFDREKGKADGGGENKATRMSSKADQSNEIAPGYNLAENKSLPGRRNQMSHRINPYITRRREKIISRSKYMPQSHLKSWQKEARPATVSAKKGEMRKGSSAEVRG